MNRPRLRVVYHGNCLDGVVSAAVVGKWLAGWRGQKTEEFFRENAASFVPAGYDSRTPPDPLQFAADEVFIVDFSLPKPLMEQLCAASGKVTLIDHHITAARTYAIAEPDGKWSRAPGLPTNLSVMFSMKASGALLAWTMLMGDDPTPDIVRLANDYDLWIHDDKDSKAIATANGGEKWAPAYAAMLLENEKMVAAAVARGGAMLQFLQRQAEEHAEHAVEVEIDGVEGLAVDAPSFLANEIADVLRQRTKGFILAYTQRVENGRPVVKASFRSTDRGPDVSEIVRKFGGGGHRNSAACVLSFENLQEILAKAPQKGLAAMMRL